MNRRSSNYLRLSLVDNAQSIVESTCFFVFNAIEILNFE